MANHCFRREQSTDSVPLQPPGELEILSSGFQKIFVEPAQPRKQVTSNSKITAPKQPSGKVLDNFFQRMVRLVWTDRLAFSEIRIGQCAAQIFHPPVPRNTVIIDEHDPIISRLARAKVSVGRWSTSRSAEPFDAWATVTD